MNKKKATSLADACETAANQAIKATQESGQAKHVHHKNRKYGSRREAMNAKIEAAKAKRAAKASQSE